MSRRKWILVIGIPAVAVVFATAGLFLRGRSRPAGPPTATAPLAALPHQIRIPGTIRARNTVLVPATTQGILEQVMAEPGQEVFEGQLLARIHNGGLEEARQAAQADLERAEARTRALESGLIAARLEASRARAEADRVRTEFEKVERNYQRQQFLFKEGATARLAFEKAQKEYELALEQYESVTETLRLAEDRLASLNKELDSARELLEERKRELEEAQQNLAATEVLSPADGVLVARNRQVGDPVGPQVPDLFQIAVDLSTLEVAVEPEPPVLERIQPGQPAVVEVVEGPLEGLPGRVLKIEQGRAIVEFANPSPAVKPGMNAQVRIELGPAPAK